ncbi:glycosyltransferase [Candidatus Bathyarchaeota archaeon]|nr:glycosyltransferase [Candidatus Bathyarchaeota archaeon]
MQEKSQFYPKVSVVIPVKNGANHVRELLDSLMQVGYEKDKMEIVVVDGKSTDKTREIVTQYPVQLFTEEKPGLNGARNTGLRHSSGEIIAFTDFDCVIPKNWITKIIENFQNSKVGCVGGNVHGYYEDFLSQYADESIMPVMRIFKKREELDSVKPPMHYPAGCNMAFKREAIEKAGLFDESVKYGFDEDELVERICKKGYKMVLDPEVLIMHKHRASIQNLLKQTFTYGRGLGNLLKIKALESAFSKWAVLCLAGFISWSALILSFTAYTLLTLSLMPLLVLIIMLLLPPVGLMIFYAYQTKKRLGKYCNILTYPFIDIARMIAFMFGMIYQTVEKR